MRTVQRSCASCTWTQDARLSTNLDKKVSAQGLTAGRPLCYNRCRRGGTHMRTELGLERSGPFLLPRIKK